MDIKTYTKRAYEADAFSAETVEDALLALLGEAEVATDSALAF